MSDSVLHKPEQALAANRFSRRQPASHVGEEVHPASRRTNEDYDVVRVQSCSSGEDWVFTDSLKELAFMDRARLERLLLTPSQSEPSSEMEDDMFSTGTGRRTGGGISGSCYGAVSEIF